MRLTIVKAHRFTAMLLLGTTLSAFYILLSPGAADDSVMNALSGILAVASIPLCLERLAMGPSRQVGAIWATITVLLTIVAFHEFARFDNPVPPVPQFDDTGDLVMLVGSVVIALLLARFDPVPRLAACIFRLAFALQCLSTTLDCLDHVLVIKFTIDSELLALIINFTQFIAIQAYFGAALLFLFSLNAARLSNDRSESAVGDLARFLFVNAGYYDGLRYPPLGKGTYLPFARHLMFIAHFLLWYPQMAASVRRITGRSIVWQAIDIFAVYLRHGLDAQTYYLFELYRPACRAEAAGYLTRFETKNGLISSLNRLFPKRRPHDRSKLGDKVSFEKLCVESGIRCVPILARIEDGTVHWSERADRRLQHDIFVKLRIGKGAKGAGFYRHLPARGHQASSGMLFPTDLLLAHLAEQSKLGETSKKGALLIQPRLRNHPDISDLAEQSLIAFRVITCQDKAGGVQVTHAMMRVLGMLEPRWRTKVEFAAPINLETGRLGQMTGDKGEMATRWSDCHLVLGVPVAGRIVPHFEDILREALNAHAVCADRFIIGWDIACTPDGPMILEGNAFLDVEFPQRVHQTPISKSPLGPILHRHLMLLDHSTELLNLMRKL